MYFPDHASNNTNDNKHNDNNDNNNNDITKQHSNATNTVESYRWYQRSVTLTVHTITLIYSRPPFSGTLRLLILLLNTIDTISMILLLNTIMQYYCAILLILVMLLVLLCKELILLITHELQHYNLIVVNQSLYFI